MRKIHSADVPPLGNLVFAGIAANRAVPPKWPNRKLRWVVQEAVFQDGGGGVKEWYRSSSCPVEGIRGLAPNR